MDQEWSRTMDQERSLVGHLTKLEPTRKFHRLQQLLCSINHPIRCAPRTLERQESLLPLQQAFLMHIYHNASIYELTLKIRIENESVSRRILKNNIVDLFVTLFLCVCLHILTVVTTIVSVR